MILEIENVKKTYKGKKKVEALKGISLSLKTGEIFGFVGPNGAGKTTLIKIIAGILRPDSGKVSIMGKSPFSPEGKRLRGFLPENPQTFRNLTGREFLNFCANVLGKPKETDRLLKMVGLEDAADRKIKEYSKGMLQRIMLAQSLIGDPPLLVYDEPLSGLDPIGRKEVKEIIKELKNQGKTVFFSSHIIEDVEELVDRAAIINEGRKIKVLELGKPANFTVRYFIEGKLFTEKVNREKLWEKIFYIRENGEIYEIKPTEIQLEELLNEGNN
ncbi:MAG: ABC transporter ATP-binding protein [Candidatus Aminicenantes bacterium]|nr:ABC transporter ATP-binding protein [Candidatus Aminicenantes bacterium]